MLNRPYFIWSHHYWECCSTVRSLCYNWSQRVVQRCATCCSTILHSLQLFATCCQNVLSTSFNKPCCPQYMEYVDNLLMDLLPRWVIHFLKHVINKWTQSKSLVTGLRSLALSSTSKWSPKRPVICQLSTSFFKSPSPTWTILLDAGTGPGPN